MRPKSRNTQKPASRGKSSSAKSQDPAMQRLQKVLAAAGLGSRRQCEELITSNRVEVDRKTVHELGTKVDPTVQEIRVDGVALSRPKLHYYVVNKPVGIVTTNRDPAGRPRVIDLIKSDVRLFPIGRLDVSSEGLILVTNDGEFANLIAHPRYGIEKTYNVLVAGTPTPDIYHRLREGVHLAEGFAHVKRLSVKKQLAGSTLLEIILDEGRNREIRRLLARVGHKVLKLKRVALGPLRLADMPTGHYRTLRKDEVRELQQAAHSARKLSLQSPAKAKIKPSSPDVLVSGSPETDLRNDRKTDFADDLPLQPRSKPAGRVLGDDDYGSSSSSVKNLKSAGAGFPSKTLPGFLKGLPDAARPEGRGVRSAPGKGRGAKDASRSKTSARPTGKKASTSETSSEGKAKRAEGRKKMNLNKTRTSKLPAQTKATGASQKRRPKTGGRSGSRTRPGNQR